MKKTISSILLVGGLVLTAGAHAATIDDFNGASSVTIDADGSDTSAYGSAIGGFRTIDITKSGILGASASVIVPPGIYSHSADALTSAISTITWDANGLGLGGVDLVEGLTNNVFNFDILSIDQGDIDLILTVVDTSTSADSFTFSGAGAGLQSVAFSSFAGVNFTSIDSISLQIVGGEASDLTLDSLGTSGDTPTGTVPEPDVYLLIAAGLLGFAGFRRKSS